MSSDKKPERVWIEPLTGFFTEEDNGSPAYSREDRLTAENAKLRELLRDAYRVTERIFPALHSRIGVALTPKEPAE